MVWDDIKKNLILHYSEQRRETSLIKDVHSFPQFNSSVEKFYGQIVEIQSTLHNNVLIHETMARIGYMGKWRTDNRRQPYSNKL